MLDKKYTCNICNKLYKSPQSLWNHKHKYHYSLTQKNSKTNEESLQNTQKNSNEPQISSIYIQENDVINVKFLPSKLTFIKNIINYILYKY